MRPWRTLRNSLNARTNAGCVADALQRLAKLFRAVFAVLLQQALGLTERIAPERLAELLREHHVDDGGPRRFDRAAQRVTDLVHVIDGDAVRPHRFRDVREVRILQIRAEEALRRYPESSRPAQLGACSLASLDEIEKAKAWLERALAIDPDDTHIKYNGACVWAQLGENDKALDLLEKWASHVGRENMDWMQEDPDLESLRELPRYKKILELIDAKITERLGL